MLLDLLSPYFFVLSLFFTTVPLLMKISTVLIICLHASTEYHERNKSYITQLFKIKKLLCEHYCLFVSRVLLFCAKRNKFFFLSGSRKIWKSFPHIGKVFAKLGQNFGQNFTIFSKNQKQYQLPGVGLISKYRSLCELYARM